MTKIKIEIEFPEVASKILAEAGYDSQQQVKLLTAFAEGMLDINGYINLQQNLEIFLDDITESGEEEDILN
jgi:hypothetical protein